MQAFLKHRPIVVNPLSLVAGVLALVSLFSPWWGYTETIGAFSFFFGLYPGSYTSGVYAGQLGQVLFQYSPLLMGLVLLSGLLAIIGSFAKTPKLVLGSFIPAVIAVIAYPVVLMYALSAACQNMSWCMLTPTGSNFGWTWGFLLGYYLTLATAILDAFGVMFHRMFLLGSPVSLNLKNPQPVLTQT